jgi:hypothetical protein
VVADRALDRLRAVRKHERDLGAAEGWEGGGGGWVGWRREGGVAQKRGGAPGCAAAPESTQNKKRPAPTWHPPQTTWPSALACAASLSVAQSEHWTCAAPRGYMSATRHAGLVHVSCAMSGAGGGAGVMCAQRAQRTACAPCTAAGRGGRARGAAGPVSGARAGGARVGRAWQTWGYIRSVRQPPQVSWACAPAPAAASGGGGVCELHAVSAGAARGLRDGGVPGCCAP